LLWLLARKKKKRQLLQQPKPPYQLLTQPLQLQLLLLTQPHQPLLLTLLPLTLLPLRLPLRTLLRPLLLLLPLLRKPLRLPSNWPGLPSSDGILQKPPFSGGFVFCTVVSMRGPRLSGALRSRLATLPCFGNKKTGWQPVF